MNARLQRAGWMFAVAFAWLWAWRHLSVEWRTNAQYHYGFGVPVMFVYMLWQRWAGPAGTPLPRVLNITLVAAAWCPIALGELLRWHDPIWRVTGGMLVLGATLLTVAWLGAAGGRPLLRRELFPIAFGWLALPWPVPVELFLTQHLLHFVTRVSALVLNNAGVAALQQGNAIEVSHGLVGIDEACSGIQSLQASLVASLFLGEFFQHRIARRWMLVAVSAIIAIIANIGRVITLTLIVNKSGQVAAAQAHDTVGSIATVCTFLVILAIAMWKSDSTPERKRTDEVRPPAGGWIAFASFALVPLLAWMWFRSARVPDANLPQRPHWSIDATALPPGWITEPLDPTPQERTMLQFSDWEGLRIHSPDGWVAQVIHLFWKPGTSMPSMAFYHTPAMCMPWAGWTQVGGAGQVTLPVRDASIPFVSYRFRQGSEELAVLQSLSAGGSEEFFTFDPTHAGNRFARLATLWRAPLRQVDEEILVYAPAFTGSVPPELLKIIGRENAK